MKFDNNVCPERKHLRLFCEILLISFVLFIFGYFIDIVLAHSPFFGGLGSSGSLQGPATVDSVALNLEHFKLHFRNLADVLARPCSKMNCHAKKSIIGSMVKCLFCFETRTTEGRGGEKGGSVNFKTAH